VLDILFVCPCERIQSCGRDMLVAIVAAAGAAARVAVVLVVTGIIAGTTHLCDNSINSTSIQGS
jgi:hypothetical protein